MISERRDEAYSQLSNKVYVPEVEFAERGKRQRVDAHFKTALRYAVIYLDLDAEVYSYQHQDRK
jgi:hypothetical protein